MSKGLLIAANVSFTPINNEKATKNSGVTIKLLWCTN